MFPSVHLRKWKMRQGMGLTVRLPLLAAACLLFTNCSKGIYRGDLSADLQDVPRFNGDYSNTGILFVKEEWPPVKAKEIKLDSVRMTNINFPAADISGSIFERVTFTDCVFDEADFKRT